MFTNNFNQSAGQFLLLVAPLERFYLLLDIGIFEPAPKRASTHTRCPCQLRFRHCFHTLLSGDGPVMVMLLVRGGYHVLL